ncbi:hypothetical protein TNCV_1351251 [Trichonephila clavipes]|nr:hypothetical protein TNCV_1351251 [Trichonephila clavipes]
MCAYNFRIQKIYRLNLRKQRLSSIVVSDADYGAVGSELESWSDTMASVVLADLTRALQGTNRGSGPAMEDFGNDVGSLEQLLLYADEPYLA